MIHPCARNVKVENVIDSRLPLYRIDGFFSQPIAPGVITVPYIAFQTGRRLGCIGSGERIANFFGNTVTASDSAQTAGKIAFVLHRQPDEYVAVRFKRNDRLGGKKETAQRFDGCVPRSAGVFQAKLHAGCAERRSAFI